MKKIILLCFLLIGCQHNQIILVPDTQGKVGTVQIINDGGVSKLTSANESLELIDTTSKHLTTKTVSNTEILNIFKDVLEHQPNPPVRFNILFASGQVELDKKVDDDVVVKVLQTINNRKSCDISSIGHADTVGTNEQNKEISVRRADNVKRVLVSNGIAEKCIDTRYYGENDLFIQTPDNTDEPRNRRVEVEIR